MSTTNVIKQGTQRVTALEQTRGAKCGNVLEIQFPVSTDPSAQDVPAWAPTVIRVETRGQTTDATLNMYEVSRNSPFNVPTWGGNGCPSKWHILHYIKTTDGTDNLIIAWTFTRPSDGVVQTGSTTIDVSSLSAGTKTLIVIMWDGFTWRTTDWFS